MFALRPSNALNRFADHALLQPDLSRALRATVAFMVPLLLASAGWISFDLTFVAIAAQNVAMVDIRGDYRLRLALVLAMVAVFVGATAIGATVAHDVSIAVLATGLMAVCGGVWRHLSSDYGPSLAISSSLVFFIALATPSDHGTIGTHALAALAGGMWGTFVQVAAWPFRPQHGLRRTVADSWLAAAALFDGLALPVATDRTERIATIQATLRSTLDHTYATLATMRPAWLRPRLEALNLAAARLATRVLALHTAIDAILDATEAAALSPVLEPVLGSLANLSRAVALTVVSRQPGHLAACDVQLRRLASQLAVVRERVAPNPRHSQLAEIVRQVEQFAAGVHDTLRATVERADERAAFSLELPDFGTRALKPLASALNLTTRVDPALVRFTLRLAALTMLGVLAFKLYGFPHGYWLPFTVVVVLQPDYGSTRQRAGQRVLGTLAGSLLASMLLWLHPPPWLLMTATAATMFAFGYYVKRDYARAIFFVTLFIVLITEAATPVTIAFTIERLASTLAGGALALGAAFVFWPVWERDRLPAILAQAFRSNRDYLALLVNRLTHGGSFDDAAIQLKRRAEAANSAAFSSLRRMSGDPKNRQDGLEYAAALINGNQRLTQAMNVLALHLSPDVPLPDPGLDRFATLAGDVFDRLADSVERGAPAPGELEALRAGLESGILSTPTATRHEQWVSDQLGRVALELSALLVALQNAAPPWNETPDA